MPLPLQTKVDKGGGVIFVNAEICYGWTLTSVLGSSTRLGDSQWQAIHHMHWYIHEQWQFKAHNGQCWLKQLWEQQQLSFTAHTHTEVMAPSHCMALSRISCRVASSSWTTISSSSASSCHMTASQPQLPLHTSHAFHLMTIFTEILHWSLIWTPIGLKSML